MYHPPPSIGFVENSMDGVRMYKVELYVRVRRACMVEGMSSSEADTGWRILGPSTDAAKALV